MWANIFRVFDRCIKWAPRGIEYESDRRRTDKLLEELGLGKGQKVVAPAIRESRKSKKKGANTDVPEGAGREGESRAGTRHTGVGREEFRESTRDKSPENAGGREDPPAGIGQTGAGRGGPRSVAQDRMPETKNNMNQDVVRTSGIGEDTPTRASAGQTGVGRGGGGAE